MFGSFLHSPPNQNYSVIWEIEWNQLQLKYFKWGKNPLNLRKLKSPNAKSTPNCSKWPRKFRIRRKKLKLKPQKVKFKLTNENSSFLINYFLIFVVSVLLKKNINLQVSSTKNSINKKISKSGLSSILKNWARRSSKMGTWWIFVSGFSTMKGIGSIKPAKENLYWKGRQKSNCTRAKLFLKRYTLEKSVPDLPIQS